MTKLFGAVPNVLVDSICVSIVGKKNIYCNSELFPRVAMKWVPFT